MRGVHGHRACDHLSADHLSRRENDLQEAKEEGGERRAMR